MIKKILMKDNLGFKNVELYLDSGLSVFTGLSGAGKSILFKAILSSFAIVESEAKFIELELDDELNLQDYGIDTEEENVFKMLKDKNTKYFINNQSISKKSLNSLSKNFIKYLSAKENNEFNNEKFLLLLDTLESVKNKDFTNFKKEFKDKFLNFVKIKNSLLKIKEEEDKIEELKELAKIQIEKISSINPKIGEYEELMVLKKKLSKKDKIQDAWNRANGIFDYEKIVIDALNLSEVDPSFFSECLNELRIISENQNLDELDFDIEELLTRIENLSYLIKRYDSIENALDVLAKKKEELNHYENISFEKKALEKQYEDLKKEIKKYADKLSDFRIKNLISLQDILNNYLKNLYMKDVKLQIKECDLSENGKDEIDLSINEANLKKLSSGEINRLRLAFIASECKILNKGKGIIFLDEIDANLSGKEAMSIANVLMELAKFYQILAISHLPQLSSKANNHFLVEKQKDVSVVKKLKNDERIKELARMVSGESISEEALNFAKTLLK